jgi:tetratricopeptide (TPR) repeat protein
MWSLRQLMGASNKASGSRRRAGAMVRAHWTRVTGAVLLAAGAPIGIAAGLFASNPGPARFAWLAGAFVCALAGTLLEFYAAGTPEGSAPLTAEAERTPPRVWNIPAPVRSFTGRDRQLVTLRAQLEARQRAAALVPAAALYGMGGVGKTQLARAYAHRYRRHYQLGWWIPAHSPLAASTALAELAARLGAPVELPQAEQLTYLGEALAERDGWLLIFDNASDPAALERFVPAAGQGHVLVTSRSSAWQGVADPVPVELLSPEAAAGLLAERTGDRDHQAAVRLAEELGRLPLAVEQAAAYATQQRLSLAAYLTMFRERRAELLARGQPLAYEGTVAAAFTLALDQLQRHDPAALQLLELCALLAPDEIPVGSLLDQAPLLAEPLASVASDHLRRGETLGVLYQAAMLTPDVDDTARLHRLVQAVTLDRLAAQDRPERVTTAVAVLAAAFPAQPWEATQWPVCARLFPHGATVVDHARDQRLVTASLGELLHRMGSYVWGRGLGLPRARELLDHAVRVRQQLHPGAHLDTARSLNNLANVVQDQGEHPKAGELYAQALAMFRQLLEGDDPRTAMALDNLATTLYRLGDHEQARDLHSQALAMLRGLHDGDNPNIAMTLDNLAETCRALPVSCASRRPPCASGSPPPTAGVTPSRGAGGGGGPGRWPSGRGRRWSR